MYIFARPENTRVEDREMLLLRLSAMSMGRRVPRSPKEPEISESGERRRVETLWWWIPRRERVKDLRWVFSVARGWECRLRGEAEGWSIL